MTKTDLVQFWKACVDRREHQLVMHISSLEALKKGDPVMLLEIEQKQWVTDAMKKLAHARAMHEKMLAAL